MLELLFHVQVGGIFEIYVEELDLARIAVSCHFAPTEWYYIQLVFLCGTIAKRISSFTKCDTGVST